MKVRTLLVLPPLGLCAVWLTGCGESEHIDRYTVPKPHVIFEANHVERADRPDQPERPQGPPLAPGMQRSGPPADRVLGAIVPQGDRTWFFKLAGSTEAIAANMQDFGTFIKSVRFPTPDAPEWTLPHGWRQEGPSGIRYATLKVGSGRSAADLTVIPLPTGDGDFQEYLLENVNRWRKELDLAPITREQLADETMEVPLGPTTATLVVLARQSRTPASHPGADQGADAPRSPASPLTYETPAGWIPGQSGGLRKAAFEVRDGERKVEITAIDLAEGAGGLLPNINRWRGQVGLDETTADKLAQEVREMPIGDLTGQYVELVGPPDAEKRETILAVIAVGGGRSWFFKLQGDPELAEREKPQFESFVRSVRFGGAEGADDGK